MIYVWILIFCINGYHECSSSQIDDIATREECQRVAETLNKTPQVRIVRCIQYAKREK